MSATGSLAAWCATAPRKWSAASCEGARNAFLDTAAVMLAGAAEPAARRVAAAVATFGVGSARVIGDTGRLPVPWAALVNGTAAHAQDYDDVQNPAMSHPSAALVPALLALGEDIGASGAACLDAYLVGYEVMARIGEAMNLVHYQRGWHTTLSIGALGVAAACARLLGLDQTATAHAISLATSMAGGSKKQFGSPAKPLHAGLAAKNGIVAARLAQAGIAATPEPLEGKWGYIDLTAGPQAPGFAGVLDKLGAISAMEEFGVWLKLYPCCAATHRSIDALRALAPLAADIVRIEARVSEIAASNLRFRLPASVAEARFSLPYCLAATVLDGMPMPASFTDAALARPAISALIGHIDMQIDSAMDATAPVTDQSEYATVIVHCTDGATREMRVFAPHGHPLTPLTPEELHGKFLACAHGVIAPAAIDAALASLAALESLDDITTLTALLTRNSSSQSL